MAACRRKESELLEFTQKLTDKNVGLQSAFTALEAKAAAVEGEHARLAAKVRARKTSYLNHEKLSKKI